MRADADHRDIETIRAHDKTTGKDLILNVPKDASMEEVMAEYTRKFNEQEGKELSKDEFRRAPRASPAPADARGAPQVRLRRFVRDGQ